MSNSPETAVYCLEYNTSPTEPCIYPSIVQNPKCSSEHSSTPSTAIANPSNPNEHPSTPSTANPYTHGVQIIHLQLEHEAKTDQDDFTQKQINKMQDYFSVHC